mmetsp:Transcript_26447/g.84769  ORF Transcript_26447/g.84769 Transcript_26447/m.84769 type:complete len:202 (+) Transcript_26447:39-644(+)
MPSVPRRHSCAAASAHRRTSSAALARELSTTYSRPRSSDPWLRSGCGALILAAQHLGRAPAGRPARHYTSARRERGRGFNGPRRPERLTLPTSLSPHEPLLPVGGAAPPPGVRAFEARDSLSQPPAAAAAAGVALSWKRRLRIRATDFGSSFSFSLAVRSIILQTDSQLSDSIVASRSATNIAASSWFVFALASLLAVRSA